MISKKSKKDSLFLVILSILFLLLITLLSGSVQIGGAGHYQVDNSYVPKGTMPLLELHLVKNTDVSSTPTPTAVTQTEVNETQQTVTSTSQASLTPSAPSSIEISAQELSSNIQGNVSYVLIPTGNVYILATAAEQLPTSTPIPSQLTPAATEQLSANQIHPLSENKIALEGFEPAAEDAQVISFGQMGIDTITLSGPTDTYSVVISPPMTWLLNGDALLELDMNSIYSTLSENEKFSLDGTLEIGWNYNSVASISISENGPKTVQVVIPKEKLIKAETENWHSLSFSFSSDNDCFRTEKSILEILSTSTITFAYEKQPYSLDLSFGLTPFYQGQSFVSIPLAIVIPDTMDQAKTAQILNFIIEYGSKTSSTRLFSVIRASDITNLPQKNSNYIFVGQTADFPILSEIPFSLRSINGTFTSDPNYQETDGIIQIAQSPWYQYRAIMFFGGDTSEGLEKAIRCFGNEMLRLYPTKSTAIISEIPENDAVNQITETENTFEDLGILAPIELKGTNSQTEIIFSMPSGYDADEGSFLDLQINYPGTFVQKSSEIEIELNETLIGSIPFIADTNYLVNKIFLPAYAFQNGRNSIIIRSKLGTLDYCDNGSGVTPWISISNQSVLHIELMNDERTDKTMMRVLTDFPRQMAMNDDLASLLWVFSENDHDAFLEAVNLAIELGSVTHSDYYQSSVAFPGDDLDPYSDKEWIIIGKTEDLHPVIKLINSNLPVPFDDEYQYTKEMEYLPSYVLGNNTVFGYTELALTPYNKNRSLLLITGPGTAGLESAALMFDPSNRWMINGTYASVVDKQIFSNNSNLLSDARISEKALSESDVLHPDINETDENYEKIRKQEVTPTPYSAYNLIRTPDTNSVALIGYTPVDENDSIVSFGQMGIDTFSLSGPASFQTVSISPPVTWNYTGDAIITLKTNIYYTAAVDELESAEDPNDTTYATLDVALNNSAIANLIIPRHGEQTFTIKVPLNTLTTDPYNNKMSLSFSFYSNHDCEVPGQTTLEISSDSWVSFEHDLRPYTLDLTRNIMPFYSSDAFVQIPLYLLVPDSLTTDTMRYIINFSSAYGSKTTLTKTFSVIRFSELTEEIKKSANFIIVGKSSDYSSILTELKLPLPFENGRFISVNGSKETDGIIQLVQSSWNPYRAFMYIGGDSDVAVTKALHAFSSETLRYYISDNLAIVTEHPVTFADDNLTKIESSFEDLGVNEDISLTGEGTRYTQISFSIPAGYTPEIGAKLMLKLTYPNTFNVSASDLSVYLNGIRLGSFPFLPNANYMEKTFSLPPYSFQSGKNSLILQSALTTPRYCESKAMISPWVSISKNSELFVDLSKSEEKDVTSMRTFTDFPEELVNEADLSNLLYVMPENNMDALEAAISIALELGNVSYSDVYNSVVALSDQKVKGYADSDWIVIGETKYIKPILEQVNENLPVKFMDDYSMTKESEVLPSYILNNVDSFGYLELGLNPNNQVRPLLLITGTDGNGMKSASLMMNGTNRRNITGTYASVADNQVFSHNSNRLSVVEPTAEIRPVMQSTQISTVTPNNVEEKSETNKVLLAVIAFNVLVIIIFVIYLISRIRKKR